MIGWQKRIDKPIIQSEAAVSVGLSFSNQLPEITETDRTLQTMVKAKDELGGKLTDTYPL